MCCCTCVVSLLKELCIFFEFSCVFFLFCISAFSHSQHLSDISNTSTIGSFFFQVIFAVSSTYAACWGGGERSSGSSEEGSDSELHIGNYLGIGNV